MLNLIRKFLRPTLREQLEAGVREALRRYADRHAAPALRVFVSTDLVPDGVDPELWSRDEAEHLRRFAIQWAEDNQVPRAGLRLEFVLLDTKREFAFVKPLLTDRSRAGVDSPVRDPAPRSAGAGSPPRAARGSALLDIVAGPRQGTQLRFDKETVVGRRPADGVQGLEDRYMSSRHARLHVEGGSLWVTDLDSKNRTFLDEQPLAPHQPQAVRAGDQLRMGTTTLRVSQVDG